MAAATIKELNIFGGVEGFADMIGVVVASMVWVHSMDVDIETGVDVDIAMESEVMCVVGDVFSIIATLSVVVVVAVVDDVAGFSGSSIFWSSILFSFDSRSFVSVVYVVIVFCNSPSVVFVVFDSVSILFVVS